MDFKNSETKENLMRAFAEMVAGERENPWSYDHELLLYRTIKKCCES